MDEFRLELLAAADHLVTALQRHAQAVGDGAVDERLLAGPELSDALGRYGVAVVNVDPEGEAHWAADELTGWLGEEDGLDEPEVGEAPEEPHVAIFMRVDVEVTDAELLRRSAADALRECGPFTEEADVLKEVASQPRAVTHLVGSGGPPLVAWLETHGLEVRAEAWQAVVVSEPMANFPETPWQPLLETKP